MPDSPPPPIIGLIANPVASKDIRRLVGLARVVDVEEKANLIARLLVGMTAGPPVRVVALDDSGGMVRRALRLTRGTAPPVEYLPLEAEATERDTHDAARLLGAAQNARQQLNAFSTERQEIADLKEAMNRLAAELGVDERDRILKEGAFISSDEAVDLALAGELNPAIS